MAKMAKLRLELNAVASKIGMTVPRPSQPSTEQEVAGNRLTDCQGSSTWRLVLLEAPGRWKYKGEAWRRVAGSSLWETGLREVPIQGWASDSTRVGVFFCSVSKRHTKIIYVYIHVYVYVYIYIYISPASILCLSQAACSCSFLHVIISVESMAFLDAVPEPLPTCNSKEH